MIYTINQWTFLLFLSAADGKLHCSLLSEPVYYDVDCSRDDPPCMGNV